MHRVPFDKLTCIAMLNTLFPPSMTKAPTARISVSRLMSEQKNFFSYIQEVEKNGPSCLKHLEVADRLPGEANQWPQVHRTVMSYLSLANSIIDECKKISAGDFSSIDELDGRTRRKADSGVSWGSDKRPSSSNSQKSHKNSLSHDDKSKDKGAKLGWFSKLRSKRSMAKLQATEFTPEPEMPKNTVRPKSSRADMRAPVSTPRPEMPRLPTGTPPASSTPKTPATAPTNPTQPKEPVVRKSKSFGALGDRFKRHNGSSPNVVTTAEAPPALPSVPAVPTFDRELMKQRRKEWQAANAKITRGQMENVRISDTSKPNIRTGGG